MLTTYKNTEMIKLTLQFVNKAAAKVRFTAITVSLALKLIKYWMKPRVNTRKGGVITSCVMATLTSVMRYGEDRRMVATVLSSVPYHQ